MVPHLIPPAEGRENDILSFYRRLFEIHTLDLSSVNPVKFAYLGDSIYDCIVREYVLQHFNGHVNQLNEKKKKLVCAGAQAEIMGYLMGNACLTAEEESLYRRARNQKTHSRAKNQSVADYRRATGFEALIGYLYCKGELRRMLTLVHEGLLHLLHRDASTLPMSTVPSADAGEADLPEKRQRVRAEQTKEEA